MAEPEDASRMPSDEDVAVRFKAGDRDALRIAWERWSGLVTALCRRGLRDAGDAEEVCADVFTEAWQQRDRFDPERGALPAWLLGIARFRIIDRQRRAQRRPRPVAATPDEPRTDRELDRIADRLLVARLLADLPHGQREVLVDVIVGQRTHAEVAEATGLPLGTVKSQVRRGLRRLADQMEEVTWTPTPMATPSPGSPSASA